MKKDNRECMGGMSYPVYQIPNMGMPLNMGMPMNMGIPMPYTMTQSPTNNNPITSNTMEQQLSTMEQQLNMLDRRVTRLENTINDVKTNQYQTGNNYSDSNYHMM